MFPSCYYFMLFRVSFSSPHCWLIPESWKTHPLLKLSSLVFRWGWAALLEQNEMLNSSLTGRKKWKREKGGKKMQLCPDTAFMELHSKPFNGFNRDRFGPKRTISNALFKLVNNLFSWYCKQGWTDPYSDLCPSLIPRPSAMQLNKLIQLQGSQVQKGQ